MQISNFKTKLAPPQQLHFSKLAIQNLSLHDQQLFETYVAVQPMAVAVMHLDEKITYFELNQQAERLALKLNYLGVREGDNVALFIERSIPMVVGIIACLKIGAAYVPQDARLTPEKQLRSNLRTKRTWILMPKQGLA